MWVGVLFLQVTHCAVCGIVCSSVCVSVGLSSRSMDCWRMVCLCRGVCLLKMKVLIYNNIGVTVFVHCVHIEQLAYEHY